MAKRGMLELPKRRLELYDALGEEIGKTPLVEYNGEIHGGNRLWIKREADNPFGSHYDRVFLALFRYREDKGDIEPGQSVLETTSGMAGISFAVIGKRLGYNCIVMLPEGEHLDRRARAIEEQGAMLIRTPAPEYIAGFTEKRIMDAMEKYRAFFMNHSQHKGANNEVTLKALEGIAAETMGEIGVDCFIPSIGNGSSALGPGRMFKIHGSTRIIGFETVQAAVAYDQMYPGVYETRFGIKPGTLSSHDLPGTSYQRQDKVGPDFPHIRSAVEGKIIDEVVLVSNRNIDEEYSALTGRNDTEGLVHWDKVDMNGQEDLGNTTRTGVAVAHYVAERDGLRGKDLLVIGYNKLELDKL